MREQIGSLAGKVWEALGLEPGIKMSKLCKQLGMHEPLTVMAVGWLTREDKVKLLPDGKDFKLALADPEQEIWKATRKGK